MLRSRLTYSNVMATVAVFIALGGTGYAASKINGKNIKARTIAGTALKNNTITGRQVNEAKLGKVPLAGHADSADSASHLAGFDPGTLEPRVAWAVVSKTGGVISQSGSLSVQRFASGTYIVDFGQDVSGRVLQATPYLLTTDGSPRGPVLVARCGTGPDAIDCSPAAPNDNRHVFVSTSNQGETINEDHAFSISAS
jgi:hypothetical protein